MVRRLFVGRWLANAKIEREAALFGVVIRIPIGTLEGAEVVLRELGTEANVITIRGDDPVKLERES